MPLADLPPEMSTDVDRLRINLAFGRGLAWSALGDVSRAISFQEETVRLAPERADAWLELAQLSYERAQRFADSALAIVPPPSSASSGSCDSVDAPAMRATYLLRLAERDRPGNPQQFGMQQR